MEQELTVLEIRRMAIHNGPGLRTMVHLKGCPLRCIWCSTPESQSPLRQLNFSPEKCIRCEACIKVCPESAIVLNITGQYSINRLLCTGCLACTKVCCSGSLHPAGAHMTAEILYKEVIKDENFFDASGGGVTLSGGEPMASVNSEFLHFLQMLSDEHISIGIDTSGYAPRQNFEAVMPFVDFFLWDLKQMDREKHRAYTGVYNDKIISNLKYAAEEGKDLYLRYPVIPGYTDDKENLKQICELAGSLKTVKELHIMPMHHMGTSRYAQLGLADPTENIPAIEEETIEEKKKYIESKGFIAKIIK